MGLEEVFVLDSKSENIRVSVSVRVRASVGKLPSDDPGIELGLTVV